MMVDPGHSVKHESSNPAGKCNVARTASRHHHHRHSRESRNPCQGIATKPFDSETGFNYNGRTFLNYAVTTVLSP